MVDSTAFVFIHSMFLTTRGVYPPLTQQLLAYLNKSGLLPQLQSAYRAGHLTETAVLKVLSDILLAIDAGDLSALVLLDLSAAFETVDHDILLQRLKTSFGLSGMVLEWFRSYLVGRHGMSGSDLQHLP